MAPRAKKANRLKRIDSVRASKDGHQFHEAWVARRALGLLLPRFDLYGIAVEGLSEEDEEGAPAAAVEIADATFYYGNGKSFETCARMEVAQFKYSISKMDAPLRIADLRKTLAKFVATEKDALARARIGDLRDMVRKKAGSHGQREKLVTQVDVLSALGLGHESELLPTPQAFPEVGNVVRRAQLSEFIASLPALRALAKRVLAVAEWVRPPRHVPPLQTFATRSRNCNNDNRLSRGGVYGHARQTFR